MNRLRYVLVEHLTPKEYIIDWDQIRQQVQQAAEMVKNKEPDVKKKNGKRKKGY